MATVDADNLYAHRCDDGNMQIVLEVGPDAVVATLGKEAFLVFVGMAARLARDDLSGLDNSDLFCYIPHSRAV